MTKYGEFVTLAELDRQHAQLKGSAFRAFKLLQSSQQENIDFWVLNPSDHAQEIMQLKSQHRVYGISINVILLAPHFAQIIGQALQNK